MTTPSLSRFASGGALVALLAGVSACAPAATTPQSTTAQAAGAAPVLLSCPAGHQPLLRQVAVNGATVPQVECVVAPVGQAVAGVPAAAPMMTAPQAPVPYPVAAPTAWAPTQAVPIAAEPVQVVHRTSRPAARRVVYTNDGYDEVRVKPRRTVKKSALIIGSSAGVGAGIGAATGGKKGALIGAAIGGGAATIWDQVTRR